jgi:hypothetical protein
MTENQSENIIQTIRLLQKLRASVGNVFQNLADGCSVTKGNEKQILHSFHESLLTVNNDFRYTSTFIQRMVPIHIGGFFAKFAISAVSLLRQRLFFAKNNGRRAYVQHSRS